MGKILRPARIGGRSKAFFRIWSQPARDLNVHRSPGPIGPRRGWLRHAILNRCLNPPGDDRDAGNPRARRAPAPRSYRLNRNTDGRRGWRRPTSELKGTDEGEEETDQTNPGARGSLYRGRSMSSPLDRAFDRDRPSPYAPRWAGEGPSGQRGVARLVTDEDSFEDDTPQPDESAGEPEEHTADDGGLVIDRFRVPRSLEPTLLPEPTPSRGRPVFGMLVRLGAAIAAAAIVALLAIGKGPTWTFVTTERAPRQRPHRSLCGPQRQQALPMGRPTPPRTSSWCRQCRAPPMI